MPVTDSKNFTFHLPYLVPTRHGSITSRTITITLQLYHLVSLHQQLPLHPITVASNIITTTKPTITKTITVLLTEVLK